VRGTRATGEATIVSVGGCSVRGTRATGESTIFTSARLWWLWTWPAWPPYMCPCCVSTDVPLIFISASVATAATGAVISTRRQQSPASQECWKPAAQVRCVGRIDRAAAILVTALLAHPRGRRTPKVRPRHRERHWHRIWDRSCRYKRATPVSDCGAQGERHHLRETSYRKAAGACGCTRTAAGSAGT